MRIVFMGTPEFAAASLEQLLTTRHEVVGVFTQPDKPKGRGYKLVPPPVKELALAHQIPVFQPQKMRDGQALEILQQLQPELIAVVAYGKLLPKEILELPKYGCINVHASLLPKYRGAAPIQWAVIDGEEETGVTTMYMAEGLDTGDVIDTAVIKLDEKETGGSLFDKLAIEGGKLIVETLSKLENGTATRTPQDDEKSSYAGKITKELGQIDFTKPAVTIERLIRGLNPWPSAYTTLDGKAMKVWDATVEEGNVTEQPGEIVEIAKHYIKVATGENYLKINEIQLAGKKRMPMDAFLNGYTIKENILGL